MKFKDYLNNLNKQLKENPEIGEYETIYSIDDEGNGYQIVNYDEASIGHFDGEYHGEFIPKEHVDEEPEYYEDQDTTPNAVCIN